MRIGFTGHRPNRLHIGVGRVRERLSEALRRVRSDAKALAPAEPLIAVSSLAEGSDRQFAEAALSQGFELHALLPMPSADYVRTFDDGKATDYELLLGQARETTVLPGTYAERRAAYQGVGRAMVDRADILVCVWDGKPAAGPGGTTEVIELALWRARPVIWIDAATDRPALVLRAVAPQLDAVPFVGLALIAGRWLVNGKS